MGENHLNFDSFCELPKFLNLTYSKWERRGSWVFSKTLCCLVLQPQYQKLPPPPLKELNFWFKTRMRRLNKAVWLNLTRVSSTAFRRPLRGRCPSILER